MPITGARRVASVLALAVIALICLGAGGSLAYHFLYPDLVVWTTFKPVEGTVTHSALRPWPGRGRFAAPDIRFSYRVDGVDYTAGQFRIAVEREGPVSVVNELLALYAVGTAHPAWFDPKDPATAVLSRRASVPGLFGAAICVFGVLGPPLLWRLARRKPG